MNGSSGIFTLVFIISAVAVIAVIHNASSEAREAAENLREANRAVSAVCDAVERIQKDLRRKLNADSEDTGEYALEIMRMLQRYDELQQDLKMKRKKAVGAQYSAHYALQRHRRAQNMWGNGANDFLGASIYYQNEKEVLDASYQGLSTVSIDVVLIQRACDYVRRHCPRIPEDADRQQEAAIPKFDGQTPKPKSDQENRDQDRSDDISCAAVSTALPKPVPGKKHHIVRAFLITAALLGVAGYAKRDELAHTFGRIKSNDSMKYHASEMIEQKLITSMEKEENQNKTEKASKSNHADLAHMTDVETMTEQTIDPLQAVLLEATDSRKSSEDSDELLYPDTSGVEISVQVYEVTADAVNIRSIPSSEGERIGRLMQGDRCTGTGDMVDNGEWIQVFLEGDNGKFGWIAGAYLIAVGKNESPTDMEPGSDQ